MSLRTTELAATMAPVPTTHAVQHDGAVADHRPVLDRAALEVDDVADHAVVADDGRVLGVVCSTLPSWMLVRAPMRISPSSPRSTALGQIELSGRCGRSR